jgi:site-specific recombinase XerD
MNQETPLRCDGKGETVVNLLPEKPDALAIMPRRAIGIRNESGLVLLNDFLKDSQQSGLAKMTLTRYAHVCREFFEHAGSLRPNEVKPRDIREYLAWQMNRGASNHTLQQDLCALRSMFRFAEAMEIVAVSPARAVQTRRYHRRLPRILTEEQVNKLIDCQENLRDKALLETLHTTGCRVSEVAGMRVQDISWYVRSIRILGKGNKERLVPVNERAIKLLKEYLGERKTGWLFQAEGKPEQCGTVRQDTTGRTEKWVGVWKKDFVIDAKGILRSRVLTRTLGKVSEMSREEARTKLAELLRRNLQPRPRPVQDRPMTPESVRMIARNAGLKAGLGHIWPHLLRHAFATHLLDHGADIVTIGRFLGHVSLTTTQIYTHVSQGKMQDTLERFHPHWRE